VTAHAPRSGNTEPPEVLTPGGSHFSTMINLHIDHYCPKLTAAGERDLSIFLRFSVWYLAAMWIVFGLMHFTLHEQTISQIPEIFPYKSALAYITGVAEVAVGILIFPKRTRKWAAFASLVLLVLLFPAMVKIVAEGSAMHGFIPKILVPGNLLLAICSWALWKNTSPPSEL